MIPLRQVERYGPHVGVVREVLPPARLELTREELDALLEYSHSLPTGTTIGKRWRRRVPAELFGVDWFVGQFIPSELAGTVGIRWTPAEVLP